MPLLLPVDEIEARLKIILPEGTPGREFAVKKNVARTIFSALYVGAIEGEGRWLAPRHIYRMSDEVAKRDDPTSRMEFYKQPPAAGAGAWYADNSREGVRDEGLRQGLVPLNATVVNPLVQPTSSRGRYALTKDFAALFDPALSGDALGQAAEKWGTVYLSPAARARAAYNQGTGSNFVEVRHPQGGSIMLPGGESAEMTKATVEVFARNFLTKPATVWISDSKIKLFDNEKMVKLLDLKIDVARLLPDVILVDLEPVGRAGKLLIVFIEIVFTAGPVDANRKAQILDMMAQSKHGYTGADAAFVTVYKDRSAAPAGRASRELAWGTFAWFVSEPDHLVQFHSERPGTLAALLQP